MLSVVILFRLPRFCHFVIQIFEKLPFWHNNDHGTGIAIIGVDEGSERTDSRRALAIADGGPWSRLPEFDFYIKLLKNRRLRL